MSKAMGEILLISPYLELAEMALKVIGDEDDVDVRVTRMDDAVELALAAEKDGYQVIVSRGLTASKIKQYHHLYKIPLHKIGITFPNIERYFAIISSVFKEYDIPYNISAGFPLGQSPLIKVYLQVIKTKR